MLIVYHHSMCLLYWNQARMSQVYFEVGTGTHAICCLLCCCGCDLGCCLIPYCVDDCQGTLYVAIISYVKVHGGCGMIRCGTSLFNLQ